MSVQIPVRVGRVSGRIKGFNSTEISHACYPPRISHHAPNGPTPVTQALAPDLPLEEGIQRLSFT